MLSEEKRQWQGPWRQVVSYSLASSTPLRGLRGLRMTWAGGVYGRVGEWLGC